MSIYSFKNDYSESCHPDILKPFAKINMKDQLKNKLEIENFTGRTKILIE